MDPAPSHGSSHPKDAVPGSPVSPYAGACATATHGSGDTQGNLATAVAALEIVTADGRVIKLLNIVDEFTREALEMLVERSIDADRTVEVLERLVTDRGAPEYLRCDNGPEMTAHALEDWCVLSGTGTAYIEPGSPWQNPYVESFHSRVRDELLDVEEFSCLAEARVVIGDWREDYNQRRPHSSLGMRSPAAFAATLAAAAEPIALAA